MGYQMVRVWAVLGSHVARENLGAPGMPLVSARVHIGWDADGTRKRDGEEIPHTPYYSRKIDRGALTLTRPTDLPELPAGDAAPESEPSAGDAPAPLAEGATEAEGDASREPPQLPAGEPVEVASETATGAPANKSRRAPRAALGTNDNKGGQE